MAKHSSPEIFSVSNNGPIHHFASAPCLALDSRTLCCKANRAPMTLPSIPTPNEQYRPSWPPPAPNPTREHPPLIDRPALAAHQTSFVPIPSSAYGSHAAYLGERSTGESSDDHPATTYTRGQGSNVRCDNSYQPEPPDLTGNNSGESSICSEQLILKKAPEIISVLDSMQDSLEKMLSICSQYAASNAKQQALTLARNLERSEQFCNVPAAPVMVVPHVLDELPTPSPTASDYGSPTSMVAPVSAPSEATNTPCESTAPENVQGGSTNGHPTLALNSCVPDDSTNVSEQNINQRPQRYGFHNLSQKTVSLADGTERSYYALPADYPLERAVRVPLSDVYGEKTEERSTAFVAMSTSTLKQQPYEEDQQESAELSKCSRQLTISSGRPTAGTLDIFSSTSELTPEASQHSVHVLQQAKQLDMLLSTAGSNKWDSEFPQEHLQLLHTHECNLLLPGKRISAWDPGIGTSFSLNMCMQGWTAGITTEIPLPWLPISELPKRQNHLQRRSALSVWDPGIRENLLDISQVASLILQLKDRSWTALIVHERRNEWDPGILSLMKLQQQVDGRALTCPVLGASDSYVNQLKTVHRVPQQRLLWDPGAFTVHQLRGHSRNELGVQERREEKDPGIRITSMDTPHIAKWSPFALCADSSNNAIGLLNEALLPLTKSPEKQGGTLCSLQSILHLVIKNQLPSFLLNGVSCRVSNLFSSNALCLFIPTIICIRQNVSPGDINQTGSHGTLLYQYMQNQMAMSASSYNWDPGIGMPSSTYFWSQPLTAGITSAIHLSCLPNCELTKWQSQFQQSKTFSVWDPGLHTWELRMDQVAFIHQRCIHAKYKAKQLQLSKKYLPNWELGTFFTTFLPP